MKRRKYNKVLLTLGDRTMTVSEWAREKGWHPRVIRHRLDKEWTHERILTEPANMDGRGRPRSGKPYGWRTCKLRAAALEAERMVPMRIGEDRLRDAWDLPMANDPWANGAIDVAMEEGGFTLDDIGHFLGVSRERARQLQHGAMLKLLDTFRQRGVSLNMRVLLRTLDALRLAKVDPDEGSEA